MPVKRTVYGNTGGLFRDPMSWTVNKDGTYHITVTRRYLGGRTETYEYDSADVPLSTSVAFARGAAGYARENPEPVTPARQFQSALAVIILTVIIVLSFVVAFHAG